MKNDIETLNKSQLDLKAAISEMKNTPEGIKSRLGETEDQISELGDKVEKKQSEQQYKKSSERMKII